MTFDPALLRRRLDTVALDVGRLRRHLVSDTYAAFLVDRCANHLGALDTLLQPTAADYCRGNIHFGLSDEEAVAEALATVDARDRDLRALLGCEAPQ